MQCLFLQGYVFFGNAKKVRRYIEAMFKPVKVSNSGSDELRMSVLGTLTGSTTRSFVK